MTEWPLESSSQQQLILFVLALVGFLGSLIIAIQVLPNAASQLLGGVTRLVTGLHSCSSWAVASSYSLAFCCASLSAPPLGYQKKAPS